MMLARPRRADLTHYGLAILAVAATIGLKTALSPLIDPKLWPLMLAIVPVLFSAWFGGWGPGLVATILTALAVDFFYMEPLYGVGGYDTQKAFRLTLFLIEGAVLSWLVDQLFVARRRGDLSAEQFELLAEGTRDSAMILMDAQGRVTEWNRGAERLLGWRGSEIQGQLFDRFYAGQEQQGGRPQQDLAAAAEQGEWRSEGWRIRKDGSRFWAENIIRPRHDRQHKLCGFSQITRDLSDRKRTEARLAAEHSVTRILADARSLQESGSAIVHAIRQSIDADIGALWFPDEQGASLSCAVIDECESGEAFAPFVAATRTMHFAPGVGLPGRVWQTRGSACIVDVQHDANFPRAAVAAAAGLRSGIAFPIVAGSEFLGVIEFLTRWKLEPDDALLRMMEAIGSEIGQFVQRRRAERQVEVLNLSLRERVQELQTLLDVAPIGIAVAQDPACEHVQVNPAAASMLEISSDDNASLSGPEANRLGFRVMQQGRELSPEELPMQFAAAHNVSLRDIVVDLVHSDGRTLHLLEYASPLLDELGRVRGCLGLFVDITEQRLAQQALQQRAEQFRASFQLAAVGKALIDPASGMFLRVNNKLGTILRMESSELTQRTVYEVVHSDDVNAVTTDIRRLVDGELPEFSNELRVVAGDGELLWTSMTATLVRDGAGRPKELIAVIQDVTGRKLVEQELERYRTRLEELVGERTAALQETHQRLRLSERMASLGTLSAGLGHDMGNLLLPVRLRLEAMEIKGIPDQLREDVQAIGKCADYLQRLANGLRLLSLDPENATASPERTDLKEWWPDVESFLKNALPRGVELERRFADDLPAAIVPRHRLTQAVFNLVQNAGDAIKPGEPGRVCIWAESCNGRNTLRLGVTDNGAGMSAEVKARCLEPFFTSKTRGISTGLGLALVHGIVQKAGGAIAIDSAPGKGTTITLTLPSTEATTLNPARTQCAKALRGAVSISDTRLRTYVSFILRLLRVDVAPYDDPQGEGLDLWVADETACERLVKDQTHPSARCILVIGNMPHGWKHSQTLVLNGHPKPAAVRQALRQLVVELSTEPGQLSSHGFQATPQSDSRPLRRRQ
jgi:PAS domain S-box-containing protein